MSHFSVASCMHTVSLFLAPLSFLSNTSLQSPCPYSPATLGTSTHPPRVGPVCIVDGEGGVSCVGGEQVADEGGLAQACMDRFEKKGLDVSALCAHQGSQPESPPSRRRMPLARNGG